MRADGPAMAGIRKPVRKPKYKKLEIMSESASTPAVIQVADALPSGGQKQVDAT